MVETVQCRDIHTCQLSVIHEVEMNAKTQLSLLQSKVIESILIRDAKRT